MSKRRSIRRFFRDVSSELVGQLLWNILTFIPRMMFRLIKGVFDDY
ncbi:hypothetical protein [Mangrovibacillus cuniculi]|uniref:Uncharacterized protein n=1 Tax=Mangrovibacillus cuniculi TaxID=2593652 RepID=A0A7S8C9I8_9BACI|nr:hypothetical protein [Mangrovibacillus cuniculi]QPC45858.1 hypothetical protein G8O30_02240 [Mangrovibacillus cuniculi]